MDVQLGVRHVAYRYSFVLYYSEYPTHEGKRPTTDITNVLKLEVKNSLRIFKEFFKDFLQNSKHVLWNEVSELYRQRLNLVR